MAIYGNISISSYH